MTTDLIRKLQQKRIIFQIPKSDLKWDIIYLTEAIINTKSYFPQSVGNRRMVDVAKLLKGLTAEQIPKIFTILLASQKYTKYVDGFNYHVDGQGNIAFFTLPDDLFMGLV